MPAGQGDMIPLVPGHEASLNTPEALSQPTTPAMPQAPTMQAPAPLPPVQPPAPAVPVNQTSAHPTAPAVADDLDLIEKEWVEKAKAIVAQTRTDPHAQNQELNQFKADYMSKRYNKQIKIEP